MDGKDCRDYTMKSLRKNYAMVLQDTWLFEGSIFDNIAYGKDGATHEEVVEAAKAAGIPADEIMAEEPGHDPL